MVAQMYDVDHKMLLSVVLILCAPILYTIHCIDKPFSHCKHCILGHGFWRHLVDCFTFKRLSYQFKFLDMIALSVRHSYLLTTLSLLMPMDSALLFHFRMGMISILFIASMFDHYNDIKKSKGEARKYFEYNRAQVVIIALLMIGAACYLIWLYLMGIINMMIPFLTVVIMVLIYKQMKRIFQVVAFKNMMDALVPPCVYGHYYIQLQPKEYERTDIVAWIVSICCLLFSSSIIFDCRDIVEDKYSKVKTLAVVYGIPTTLWIALAFNVVSVLIQCLHFGGNPFGLIAIFLGSINLWCIVKNYSTDEYFHLHYLFLFFLISFT